MRHTHRPYVEVTTFSLLKKKEKGKKKKNPPRIIMGEKEGTNSMYVSGLLKDADTVQSI